MPHPIAIHDETPPISFYLTQPLNKSSWTQEEAKTHLVNETMLQLRPKITLQNKHRNPIRNWEDGSWRYEWLRPSGKSALCILTAIIVCDETIFTLRPPQLHLAHTPQLYSKPNLDITTHGGQSMGDPIEEQGRQLLFGCNPPQDLPMDFITPTTISETTVHTTEHTLSHLTGNGDARPSEVGSGEC